MLAFFSASAAVSLYKITLKKYDNVNQAIITVIIYSLASGIFRFSSQVEYLILVPSLGIISLYVYSKGQNLIAGILFGLGLLTSPFIVLFTPIFLLFTSIKELFKRQNIIFALSMIAVYFIINIFTYRETISGNWSYGMVFNFYKEALSEINYLRVTAIYLYGYLRSFNIIIFILPFALYYLFNSNKELFYVLIITILIHLPVAIPEARYGGYQMTAYPIIAISAAYLLNNLLNKYRYRVLLILFLYVIVNVFLVYSERSFFKELKETYLQLNKNLEENSVLIVYQDVKPIKNIYATNLQVLNIRSGYQNKLAKDIPGSIPTDLIGILNKNENVYILESGVSMPDDYFKLIFSKFTKNQGAKVKGFGLETVLAADPSFRPEKLVRYPLDVYKLTNSKSE
jgi:hypothetical protein